jgi:amidase
MLEAFAKGRHERSDRLPPMVKLQALVGQWMHDTYEGRYYATAQNAGRRLTQLYDAAFESHDLLVLPTTPLKATRLPKADVTVRESTRIAHEMGANTSPFNVSGHPAINVPCALSDGLPVGMMIVGRRWEDATVLRAAHVFETEVFRLPAPPSQAGSTGH